LFALAGFLALAFEVLAAAAGADLEVFFDMVNSPMAVFGLARPLQVRWGNVPRCG
jgi:hypothetical protein